MSANNALFALQSSNSNTSVSESNLIRERRGEANREAGAVELGEEREGKVLLGWNDKLAFAEQNF